MKNFKPNTKMGSTCHYSYGGNVMKKASGGSVTAAAPKPMMTAKKPAVASKPMMMPMKVPPKAVAAPKPMAPKPMAPKPVAMAPKPPAPKPVAPKPAVVTTAPKVAPSPEATVSKPAASAPASMPAAPSANRFTQPPLKRGGKVMKKAEGGPTTQSQAQMAAAKQSTMQRAPQMPQQSPKQMMQRPQQAPMQMRGQQMMRGPQMGGPRMGGPQMPNRNNMPMPGIPMRGMGRPDNMPMPGQPNPDMLRAYNAARNQAMGIQAYRKGGKVMKNDNERMEKFGDNESMERSEGGSTNFIQNAIKKPGALHKSLGVPMGKKIPAAKLEKAANAPGKLGQRARFAQTLKGMK